jgi:hypothetical protein
LAAETSESASIAQAVAEISERATTIVREEIELAKAEITGKLIKLLTGAVVAFAAGIFLIVALLFALHGFAWLATYELFPHDQVFWGYFVVAGGLILLGVLAGLAAALALRRGTPPTPTMAIDEARKLKDSVAKEPPS